MTASKFRPAVNNPYLLLTRDDDDEEIVELDRVLVFFISTIVTNLYYNFNSVLIINAF
jgi:hypothetical protein